MSGVANAFARTDVVPPVMSRKHAEILFAYDEVSQVGHPAIQPANQLAWVMCSASVASVSLVLLFNWFIGMGMYTD